MKYIKYNNQARIAVHKVKVNNDDDDDDNGNNSDDDRNINTELHLISVWQIYIN